MKTIFTLIVSLTVASLFAQSKIVGYVKRQNSGNEMLANAAVWSEDAAAQPLSLSNEEGYFELDFPTKKTGDVVSSISVSLEGYEVVNEKSLENHSLISSPEDDPLIVILCPEGEYRRTAGGYYQKIYYSGKSKLQAEKKRLEQELKKEHPNTSGTKQQLVDIIQQLENLPRIAASAADYFAQIDSDLATELQKNALLQIKKGNIAAALEAMPEAEMDKNITNALQLNIQLETRKAEHNRAVRQNIENYLFKIRLYISQSSYAEAERLYEKVIAVCSGTTQVENMYNYAAFLEEINRYEKALFWLGKLTVSPDAQPWQIGNAYCLMGQLYEETGNFTSAKASYLQCNSVFDSLYSENTEDGFYKYNLAISNSKLGTVYQSLGQLDTALVYLLKRSKLIGELYEKDPQNEAMKDGLAVSYGKLVDIYRSQGQLNTALVYCVKATGLYEELHAMHPRNGNLKDGLAVSYSQLGTIYQYLGQLDTALVYFIKRSRMGEELYESNPGNEGLKNGLAVSYSKLGTIYQSLGQLDTALWYFLKDLKLSQELHESNPKNHDLWYGLGISYCKLGAIHKSLGQWEQAISYYKHAVAVYRDLYSAIGLEKYKSMYLDIESEIEYLTTPPNPVLEKIQELEKQVAAAKTYQEKAWVQKELLEQQHILLEATPDDSELQAYIADGYGRMAWYLIFCKEFPAAEVVARRGIALHPAAEWVHTNLALALLYQGRYAEAEAIYKKYQSQSYDSERSWAAVFLTDLADLEAAGIRHPDVSRIRAFLQK